MAITTLANYGAPTINGVAAGFILSQTVLESIWQGIIERDKEGITQRFTTDCSGAQIRILHVKPVKQFARRLGAAVNGGNFPVTAYEGETDSFGLDVLDVLDTPFDLAQVTKEMIPVDLLSEYLKSYAGQVNLALNASTIAGKYYATVVKEAAGGEVNITKYEDGGDFRASIVEANSLLDEGVEEFDVAEFPDEGRCFVIQAKYRATLLNKGVLILGGANSGYEIAKDGTVSAGATPTKLHNGFIGTVDGLPVHIASSTVFKKAAEYLGLTKEDLTQAIGYISSYLANVRGIASPESIKVIDNPNGQGVRVQPLTRWGFAVLPGYEKGNSFIMKDTYVNPYAGLKQLFGLSDLKSFTVIPSGSRIPLDSSSVASKGTITVTCPNASEIAIVVDNDDTIKSVAGFNAFYQKAGAASYGNTLESGKPFTLTGITSGCLIKVLCMAADGTCELTSVKAA